MLLGNVNKTGGSIPENMVAMFLRVNLLIINELFVSPLEEVESNYPFNAQVLVI